MNKIKGKRSIRTAMVLVTSFLLVSLVASGVMASPPKASGDSDSNSLGSVEISLDVGSEEKLEIYALDNSPKR
ncbi:MAG: hypothetical protein ACOCTN_05840 [Candidatus Natronoplasma sp.]